MFIHQFTNLSEFKINYEKILKSTLFIKFGISREDWFFQKIEQPDEVEVSLLVQENEERSLPETIEDLKRILDVGEMDYQLDTPPLSPLGIFKICLS